MKILLSKEIFPTFSNLWVEVSKINSLSLVIELGVKEINSREIGERVLPKLRLLDGVSYVRFASIYRDFRDIDEFVNELSEMKKAK